MKILVVGINYAPEVTGIAPYTTGLAEYLASCGHDVEVITSMPHYPAWKVSADHAHLPRRDTVRGVELRRLDHYVPDAPSVVGRVRMELEFAFKAVVSPWDSPDVVLCVSPSLLSSAGALLRVRLGRNRTRGFLWSQDLYSKGASEAVAVNKFVARLTAWAERAVFGMADEVVVIHDRFRRTAIDVLRSPLEKISVVRNWTHIEGDLGGDPGTVPMRFGATDRDLLVLHAGNMGAKQGLENVVEAARLADASEAAVRFVLMGDGNQRKNLERIAEGVKRIEIIDPLGDSDFRAAISSADVLLLNEKPGVSDMAVPSKLTTYFAAGKPIVAATHPESASADEIRASSAGVLVAPGSPEELLQAVLSLGADVQRRADLGEAGRRYKEENLTSLASLSRFEHILARSGTLVGRTHDGG